MTARLEDLLSVVCSHVEAVPSHNAQKIFLLGNEKEAQIACDILVTHGFGAKLYHENGASRLYVAEIASDKFDQSITSALAYARMMKTMQQSIEAMRQSNPDHPEYSISMRNVSAQDKAISIHLVTPAKIQISEKSLTAAVAEMPKSAAPAKTSATATAAKKKTSDPYQSFMTGPQLTQESWLARYQQRSGKNAESLMRRATLYIFGNAASAGYIIGTVLLFLLIIYSLLGLSKAYFCQDFLKTEKQKSQSWYCTEL